MNCIRNFRAVVTLVAVLGMVTGAHADHLLGWNFDELSGDALDNGSAPDNDGVLTGGAARSTDTPNNSGFSIDLRDDASAYKYVLSGDAQELDGLSALTLTTWIKLEEYTSGNFRLSAKQAAGTFDGFSWNLNATVPTSPASENNVTMALFLGGAGGFAFDVADDASFDGSEWTFLAVTYDSATSDVIFYTGGQLTPVSPFSTGTVAAGVLNDSSAPFGVGYTDAAPASDTSLIGWQDDVRVWGRALTAAQLEGVRQSNTIPEPASVMLLALACGTIACRRR